MASHIKPWARCDNDERLDPNNGLLLSPTLDACFDAGYISFDDDGNIMISDCLTADDALSLGVGSAMALSRVEHQHRHFLQYHRDHVFKASSVGTRKA